MTHVRDLLGQRFGMLTVSARAANSKSGKARWTCLCDCGGTTTAHGTDLSHGHTTSCGCHRLDVMTKLLTTHGGTGRPEYSHWCSIKDRCYNPKNPKFGRYGGRGILMCDEWRGDFAAFFADMGPRPSPTHSVDRIDNNKGYEPGNCRWATPTQQARNTRRTRYVAADGIIGKLPEVAERLNISPGTLKARAKRGTYGTRYVECLTDPRDTDPIHPHLHEPNFLSRRRTDVE